MNQYTITEVAKKLGTTVPQVKKLLDSIIEDNVDVPGVYEAYNASSHRTVNLYSDEFIEALCKYQRALPLSQKNKNLFLADSLDDLQSRMLMLIDNGYSSVVDIAEELDIPLSSVRNVLSALEESGYLIKETGNVVSFKEAEEETHKVSTPKWNGKKHKIGVVSDLHVANKYCKMNSLQKAYKHMAKKGCEFVIFAGDLFDGPPSMHQGFEYELQLVSLEEQMDFVLEHYPTDLPTLFLAGNHDLSWMKRCGFDPVKGICRTKSDVWTYIGTTGAWLASPAGDPHFIYVYHPGDGAARTFSYKSQKISEWLAYEMSPMEKFPKIVLSGHYHKYCLHLGVANSYNIMLPAACGMTGFQRQKNLINHCGVLTIEFSLDDNENIVTFLPEYLAFEDAAEVKYSLKETKNENNNINLWRK